MQSETYLTEDVYYALVEALDRLRPQIDVERDGGSTIKMILGEVGGIWPAWLAREQSNAKSRVRVKAIGRQVA